MATAKSLPEAGPSVWLSVTLSLAGSSKRHHDRKTRSIEPGGTATCKPACGKGQPKITGLNMVLRQKHGANPMGWRGEPIAIPQGSQKAKAEDWSDPECGTVLHSGRSEGDRPAARGLPFR